MTLNITLVVSERIYQSCDFRLTKPGVGALTYDSMKAVHLAGQSFYGALTYTGIGEWEGRSTAEYLVEWLADGADMGLSAVVERLVEKGNVWLARIERVTRTRYPHTFVVAGFEAGTACVALVSNFESLADQRPSIRDQLTPSSMRRPNRPMAVVTGQRRAVERTARRGLERAAKRYSNRPQRVRQLLAEVNAVAAKSPRANGTISADCAVFSLDRGGSGHLTLTAAKSIDWYSALSGAGMPSMLGLARKLGMSSPRLVAATTVTSGGQPFAAEAVPCLVQPVMAFDSPYSVVELRSPGHGSSWCRGINNRSVVIGAGSTSEAPGEANLWTWRDGEFVDLQLSVTNSGAMAINDAGDVGGAYSVGVGTLRPFVVREGDVVELMPGADVDAAVQALAPDGTAVGYVSRSATDRGQLHQRPAIWHLTGEMDILDDIPADWGTANAINQRGETLLSLHQGMWTQTLTAIFFDGRLVLLDGTGVPGLIPMGLDNFRRVLGFFNDAEGRPVACLSTLDSGTERLGTAPGWYPCAISASGWIAGSLREGGFERPWVRAPDGSLDLLPYLPDHWCRPAGVSDSGDVVGTCSADDHQHALYWRRAPGAN